MPSVASGCFCPYSTVARQDERRQGQRPAFAPVLRPGSIHREVRVPLLLVAPPELVPQKQVAAGPPHAREHAPGGVLRCQAPAAE
jgi:hypothetical protein